MIPYKLSLAYLTIQDLSPIEAVKIASSSGFSHIGIRLLPAIYNEFIYPIIGDKQLKSDLKKTLNDYNIEIADAELIRLNAKTDILKFKELFDTCEELNINNITVVSDDPNINRFTEKYTSLCDLVNPYNISLNIEPIPWTSIKSYEEVINIVTKSNKSNSGILIDTYHFNRLNTSYEIFNQIDSSYLKMFQLSDAPLYFESNDDYIRNEARNNRLLPGKGEIELENFIPHIPHNSIISLEIPNKIFMNKYKPLDRAKIIKKYADKLLK